MILFFTGLLLLSRTSNCKYGKRYFYDPFSDWDREYYDASLEDLNVAAPPPPKPPSTPFLNVATPFSLPANPFAIPSLPLLPNFPSGYGPNFQPNFPGLFEGYNYGGPGVPSSRFDGFPSNGGYGQFRNPLGYSEDLGYVSLPSRSFFGGNPGYAGLSSQSLFGGNPGYPGPLAQDYHQPLTLPFSTGPQINLPPPFDTSGPLNFGNQIWRPPPYQHPILPFSNYDGPWTRPIYPAYPPIQVQRPPLYLPSPSQNLPAFQFSRPSRPLVSSQSAFIPLPIITRGRQCRPRKYPGVTGVCSNYFDIINRRTCVQLSVDSKTVDCPESQWCCYRLPREPSVRGIPTSVSQSLPAYQFTTREFTPSVEDYFRVESKSIVPVFQDDSDKVILPKKHIPVEVVNDMVPTIRPDITAALERGGVLRLVPRTLSSDSSSFTTSGETCGRPKVGLGNRGSRVLRGDLADVGEFCWQVAIFHNGTFICGGALVSRFHVITSAHCVFRFDNSVTPFNLEIRLGTSDISQTKASPCQQTIPVGSITLHPSFSSETLSNDIAIIRLTRLARMDHCTCTLCLPGVHTPPLRMDSLCLATGFGHSSLTGSRFGRLRSSPVQIINSTAGPASCQRMLDGYSGTPIDYKLDSSMFCSISRDMENSIGGGKGDLCPQDYGSPLACAIDSDHPDQWTLIGLATWSLGCGTTTKSSPLPSIYTHVKKQMSWISLNLE